MMTSRDVRDAKTDKRVTMSAPDVNEDDVRAVMEVVRSGQHALGPRAVSFEGAVAEYVGVRHGVAVSSGTAALHLIVRALGLGRGDEVLVPSFTFAASVNVLLFEGVTPVFVDIDPDTFTLSIADLARKVTRRTRAIMVVDVFGHPAEWDGIEDFAASHRLEIIDDSCEALGAEYRGRKLGSLGRAAAFAFYPNKQITTGEGGMIVTNDDSIAASARSLRNQGRAAMGAWLEHQELGYNYRMDEMSAALGESQFSRIERFMDKRERVARLYSCRLDGLSWLRPPVVRSHVRMSWFVYVVTLADGVDRATLIAEMESRGIPTRAYFPPVHRQPYARNLLGDREWDLPVTENVSRRTIALPFHNRMDEHDVDRVIAALHESAGTVDA